MNFKKLLVIVFLLSPAAPNFAMESKKEIYEIIAAKTAADKILYGETIYNTQQERNNALNSLKTTLGKKYKGYEEKVKKRKTCAKN